MNSAKAQEFCQRSVTLTLQKEMQKVSFVFAHALQFQENWTYHQGDLLAHVMLTTSLLGMTWNVHTDTGSP